MTCTPQSLANAAVCYMECIPDGAQAAVTNYLLAQLLNQLNGASTDPKVILQAATAYPNSFLQLEGVQDAVQSYLLCQLATASGA